MLSKFKSTYKKAQKEMLTLQSRAYFLAIIIAAFLSLSDSNVNTNERPFLGCQNNAFAAALPSTRAPHNQMSGKCNSKDFRAISEVKLVQENKHINLKLEGKKVNSTFLLFGQLGGPLGLHLNIKYSSPYRKPPNHLGFKLQTNLDLKLGTSNLDLNFKLIHCLLAGSA